jgi:uncharacterized membrane protein YqiK
VFLPFAYRIHKSDLVTVGQGTIAYVFARDGLPLEPSQVPASNDSDDKSDFQDARRFLLNGGQKGPQRKSLREGAYAINTTQFAIVTDDRVYGHALSPQEQKVLNDMAQTIADRDGLAPVVLAADPDVVGIVTVHDGPSLPPGEIIAPEFGVDLGRTETFHNNFQEPEKFLAAGGFRGRQLQVVVDGAWYINRLFATVDSGRPDHTGGEADRGRRPAKEFGPRSVSVGGTGEPVTRSAKWRRACASGNGFGSRLRPGFWRSRSAPARPPRARLPIPPCTSSATA